MWDLNNVRKTVKKLAHSLPSDGIVGHDGIVTRRTGRRAVADKKARIIRTLQRADLEGGREKVSYYTFEFLGSELEEWSDTHGIYKVDDLVKFTTPSSIYGDIVKVYSCKMQHMSSLALPPGTPSHWEESSEFIAGVFSYDEDLITSVPWYQPGNLVHVIQYDDERFPNIEWWIKGTVSNTEYDDGGELRCSITWNDEEHRIMAVYG
jgi:hypothetical protein